MWFLKLHSVFLLTHHENSDTMSMMIKTERCSLMKDYCIVSDGSCDLPAEVAARENITVVPFYV